VRGNDVHLLMQCIRPRILLKRWKKRELQGEVKVGTLVDVVQLNFDKRDRS
jgi:hypothetical protein